MVTGDELLREWGVDDATPAIIEWADEIVSDARNVLADNADASNEEATEVSDSNVPSDALDLVRQSKSLLTYEHGFDKGGGIEQDATYILYELGGWIAQMVFERERPAMDWSQAQPGGRSICLGWNEAEGFIYAEIRMEDEPWGTKLAISGETRDSGGQIDMHIQADDFEPAPGLSREDLERFFAIWDRWHLNDMNAYCEHQRAAAELAGVKPHEMFQTSFDLGGGLQGTPEQKLAGEADAMCPVCGYQYGSEWRREPLPEDVKTWLQDFEQRAREALHA